jgi:hypothetical protein
MVNIGNPSLRVAYPFEVGAEFLRAERAALKIIADLVLRQRRLRR